MSATLEDVQLLPPISVPVPEPDRLSSSWKVGKYTFRADFDSANLSNVKQGHTPSEYQLWTRRDCQDTDHERGTRSWFYYGVSGHQQGDFIVMTIMNLNKQGRLFSQDYRPWCWNQSQSEWLPTSSKASYKREGDDFQLRFSHKFESADEVFFAFAIPFSYRDTQVLLSHVCELYQPSTFPTLDGSRKHLKVGGTSSNNDWPASPSNNSSGTCSNGKNSRSSTVTGAQDSQVYFHRQLLARSLDGRRVDLLTISDWYGGVEEGEPQLPPAAAAAQLKPRHWLTDSEDTDASAHQALHFPNKKVFFISARVHPGETPATHLFNGMLAFLLRRNDPRAAALRRLFVFKLVPIVNPDGVYHGFYRTDTLGQNLNRYYLGNPDKEKQPSVWAIKRQLMQYAAQGSLEFYLDLHAHANKKGVFIYGNALEGQRALASLLYAKLVALNNPVFDFNTCNYTEKNMSRADKDGVSKEGAARVALFKETGLTHLYTIEANYNTARIVNVVSPANGDHGGRASPPAGRRFPPKFTTPVLHGVGRAFVIAALDLNSANPWTRIPNSEHRSLEGTVSWITSVSRAPPETRAQHLPALSDACIDSLRSLPNCVSLESLGLPAPPPRSAASPVPGASAQRLPQKRSSLNQSQISATNGVAWEISSSSSQVIMSSSINTAIAPMNGVGGGSNGGAATVQGPQQSYASSTLTSNSSFILAAPNQTAVQSGRDRRASLQDGRLADREAPGSSTSAPQQGDSSELPQVRRSSHTNPCIPRKASYLPSLPATPGGGNSQTQLQANTSSSNLVASTQVLGQSNRPSSIPSLDQNQLAREGPTAFQQAVGQAHSSAASNGSSRVLGRSTSLPARNSVPAAGNRTQASHNLIPSNIPRPPSITHPIWEGVALAHCNSVPSSAESQGPDGGCSEAGSSAGSGEFKQHMGALPASSNPARRSGRVRVVKGLLPTSAVAQVPLSELRMKLSEPINLKDQGAAPRHRPAAVLAPPPLAGNVIASAAALVLASGPWQQQHDKVPDSGCLPAPPSTAVPCPVTPRLHSRLLAALPKPPGASQGQGQPTAEGVIPQVDGAQFMKPVAGSGPVATSIDPILSNLKVVGRLPAFKSSSSRRRVMAGI